MIKLQQRIRLDSTINHQLFTSCHLTIYLIVYIISSIHQPIRCNPLGYDPTVAPMLSFSPMPLQAPMLMSPSQYGDPYGASMHMPHYIYAPSPFHYGPMPYDQVDRRSNANNYNKKHINHDKNRQEDMNDEQKALAGIPLSFIEPDGPSTLPERISDSFSAIGEGVKNHFRSLTENFSDTIDDIKDAWRFESSKKRNRRMINTP